MSTKVVVTATAALALIIFAASIPTAVRAASTSFPGQLEVEKNVRTFFAATPVMAEIARCESEFRQFNDSGTPLRGGIGGGMIGVFQFYERIHSAAAKNLGFDLATLEGNLGYAKHVYSLQGTEPWNSSHACWKDALLKKPAAKSNTSLSTSERKALLKRIEELTALVIELQKLLIQKQLASN